MKKKFALMATSLVLVAALAVGGTLAYLTSKDTVTNTFTVGQVKIKLDEAKTTADGTLVADDARVKANSYKLMPGHTYNKDPMVTVLKNSEESYVKMTVTFSHADELDGIFAPNGAEMTSIFKGYDSSTWIAKGNTKDDSTNTRTYEFWYNNTVAATTDADFPLAPLFKQIEVPGTITNEQLATINNMTITVNAYAIQADGFANAEAAWAAFPGA